MKIIKGIKFFARRCAALSLAVEKKLLRACPGIAPKKVVMAYRAGLTLLLALLAVLLWMIAGYLLAIAGIILILVGLSNKSNESTYQSDSRSDSWDGFHGFEGFKGFNRMDDD